MRRQLTLPDPPSPQALQEWPNASPWVRRLAAAWAREQSGTNAAAPLPLAAYSVLRQWVSVIQAVYLLDSKGFSPPPSMQWVLWVKDEYQPRTGRPALRWQLSSAWLPGQPRPGATPPSDTPLREALNRTSQWAIPHALEGACLFRRHRLIRSEQELFVPRPGAAPDLWETFWAPQEASEPSRALGHALGAQALALTLPAPSPLPASRARL